MTAPEPQALLARLGAFARPAGSAAEADARRYCAEVLSADGFDVIERPFAYSAVPGVLGTPLIGIGLVLTALATGFSLMRTSTPEKTMVSALAIVAILAISGWWLARYGTRYVPLMRRTGVNLEARRGEPVVWLVAHLDSKSQPISLLMRAGASIAVVSFWLAILGALGVSAFAQVPVSVVLVLLALAGLAAVPLAIAGTGSDGSGALDNATGVASIIVASRRLGAKVPVGLLITSAEELGLAGARAWVAGQAPGIAINCDGVDDLGELTVTASGLNYRRILRSQLGGSISGRKVRIRKNLPGVFLDSTAFADSGWTACTVSRGKLESLGRIHTRRDCLAECSGAGLERAAELIAALAGAIIAGKVSPQLEKGVQQVHETATSG